MYLLQFDGMLRASGSGWPADLSLLGYGWVLKRWGAEIARGFGLFLRKSPAGSNAAEYLALIEGLEALSPDELRRLVVKLGGMTVRERIEKLDLRPDRADVILPAAIILQMLLSGAGARQILIPGVGLKDGVLIDMAQAEGSAGQAREGRATPRSVLATMR